MKKPRFVKYLKRAKSRKQFEKNNVRHLNEDEPYEYVFTGDEPSFKIDLKKSLIPPGVTIEGNTVSI